jgi:DnaJ-class molecular chaperone
MRMRHTWWILVPALMALVILAVGCVERRSAAEIKVHPSEWDNPAAADFHGARVLAQGSDECEGCHGANNRGALDVPTCDECHAGAGGHVAGWMEPSQPAFHGNSVAAQGPTPCRACHGSDYQGGSSGASCYTCHAGGPSGHPDGWMNLDTASFHGQRVLIEGIANCQRCHGAGLSGGTSGVACSQCHDVAGGHPAGWMDVSGPNFHGETVAAQGPSSCRACHGTDYRGGSSGVSCFTCHADGPSGHPSGWMNEGSSAFHGRRAQSQGTADCKRCHGADLRGGTSGVGCNRCHDDD